MEQRHRRYTPGEALHLLLEGNRRFVEGRMIHPRQSPEYRKSVAKEQHPIVVVLRCPDSRCSSVYIFDLGIGDAFEPAEAGCVLGDITLGTIEYGVGHLYAPLLLVLVHTNCGAFNAAVYGGDEKMPGNIPVVLERIDEAVRAVEGQPGDPVFNAAKVHAMMLVERLSASPVISEAVRAGETMVVPAIYHLETGEVEPIFFYRHHTMKSD